MKKLQATSICSSDDEHIIYSLQYLLREAEHTGNDNIVKAIELAITLIKRGETFDHCIEQNDEDVVAGAVLLIKSLSMSYKDKQKLIDTLGDIAELEKRVH